jgi:hypothetical protein
MKNSLLSEQLQRKLEKKSQRRKKKKKSKMKVSGKSVFEIQKLLRK